MKLHFLKKAYRIANNYVIGKNRHIYSNSVLIKDSLIKRTSFNDRGDNNQIFISGSYLYNVTIEIYGSNNRIEILDDSILHGCILHIEDSDNSIVIGERTTIEKNTEIAAIEGTVITIGQDCMISSDVRICTGDSHSVVDLLGNRLIPSSSIGIGNHVWIGFRSVINKGVSITDNSIIGACSLVTKSFKEANIVVGGVPARKLKDGTNWERQRI